MILIYLNCAISNLYHSFISQKNFHFFLSKDEILVKRRQLLCMRRRQYDVVIVISKCLKRYSKAQGTSLFTSAATNQRGFSKGVKRSSGPISRVPGGDRVAVRVGVVEMGTGNDQKGQGRSD